MRTPCPRCSSSSGYQGDESSGYCHKCTFKQGTVRNFQSVEPQEIAELPADYTEELPDHVLQYFYQYGILQSILKEYSIGYSASMNYIIFPLTNGGYQARRLGDWGPKYLNPSAGALTLFYSKSALARGGVFRVVIVEDIVSAIKVGLVTPAVALMGSKIKDNVAQLNALMNVASHYDVWLDSDQAGRKGTRQVVNRLTIVDPSPGIIQTEHDPKWYSLDEITTLLDEAHE